MDNLDLILKQQGRKKNWLAAQLGLTPSEFSQKRSGFRGRCITAVERERIASALGVGIEVVFPAEAIVEEVKA